MGLNMFLKIFSLFFMMSCSLKKETASHHGHHANKHMLRQSHENLIAEFEDPERDEWQKPEQVVKILGDLKDKKIVDLGSGSGYFTAQFLKTAAIVTAADIDEKFLKHIATRFPHQAYPQLKIHLMKPDDPQIQIEVYDYAFSCNTYHHIDNRVTYFKKVLKGLKKGGKIMIVDFSAYKTGKKSFGPPAHLRLPADLVVQELGEAGLKDIKVLNDVLEHQYIITGSKTF